MENKNNYKGWIYLLPAIILIALFTLYPLINTFLISFLEDYKYATGSSSGFTFDNYAVLLGLKEFPDYLTGKGQIDAFFQYALPNTLLITFITVPISIVLALIIAVALNSIKKLRTIFQTIFFTPYVTNIIAVGMVFGVLFSQTGLINEIFGTSISFIPGQGSDAPTYFHAMLVLCIEIIWYELPFKILVFIGGLQSIDRQYYDAARIDATPKIKRFLHITVPFLSPQILYVSITSFIDGFKEYQAIAGLFNSRGTTSLNYNLYTCVYFIYDQIQTGGQNINYACAAAVILFVIILLFTLLQLYVSKKRVYY